METFTPIHKRILYMLDAGATDVAPSNIVGSSLVVLVKNTVGSRVVFGSYIFNHFESLIRDVSSIVGKSGIRFLGEALDEVSFILDVEVHVINKVNFQHVLDGRVPDFNYLHFYVTRFGWPKVISTEVS